MLLFDDAEKRDMDPMSELPPPSDRAKLSLVDGKLWKLGPLPRKPRFDEASVVCESKTLVEGLFLPSPGAGTAAAAAVAATSSRLPGIDDAWDGPSDVLSGLDEEHPILLPTLGSLASAGLGTTGS